MVCYNLFVNAINPSFFTYDTNTTINTTVSHMHWIQPECYISI